MSRALALALAGLIAGSGCKKKESSAPVVAGGPTPAPIADDGGAAAARSLASIVATCASATGDVQVRRGAGTEWQRLAVGAVLRPGDVVRTGSASSARIEFVSGGGLALEQDAEVALDAAASAVEGAAPESRISVEKGVVRGFMPQDASAPLLLRTEGGGDVRLAGEPGKKPVAVRLTRGASGTEVAVTSGKLRVTGAGGERHLASGQAADVTAAGVADAVQLLDFPASIEPGIDARFRFMGDMAIHLAWRPVKAAVGYRVQVARDLSFQEVEQVLELTGTDTTLKPQGEGIYAWRVASRDGSGRVGEFGFARRIYCEREQPQDLLVGPPDQTVVKFTEPAPRVEFTWQSAGDADSYRLVVASGPDLLKDTVWDFTTTGQRLAVDALEPGTYHWGVYVKDARGPIPIFVKPRQLVVQKLAKPKVDVPKSIKNWGK